METGIENRSRSYRIITARDEIEVAIDEEHGGCVRAVPGGVVCMSESDFEVEVARTD
jgi:hypothetical protein